MMAFKGYKKIRPLLDRILVQRPEPSAVSKGGIVLPEKSRKTEIEGVVVAVGTGHKDPDTGKTIPPVIKVGDRVLLPEFGGRKLTVDEKELFLFREADILAILE